MDTTKTKTVIFRLNGKLADRVRRLAEDEGLTMTAYVRRLLLKELKRLEAENENPDI